MLSPHCCCLIWQGRRVLLNVYEVLTNDERFKGGDSGPASFCPERWLGDDEHRAGAWCGASVREASRAMSCTYAPPGQAAA